MSRWVSGLAGSRSFMSVPVHTGRREEAGQRAPSRELLQPGCLLHTHSPESCPQTRTPPPRPLHLQKLQQQKKVCKFGKRREVRGEAPSDSAHSKRQRALPCKP